MTSHLSDVHAMLATIERATDASRINEIANHPDIYPFVHGALTGKIDLTDALKLSGAVALVGEHGFQFYGQIQPGLYEVHTSILKPGRGKWAVSFVAACLHWMFTHTDAMEIMTRCPRGNLAAVALARRMGLVFEFTNPHGWVMNHELVPADIYALRIQDWMRNAPGLEERGRWFHQRLEEEMARLGRTEPQHDDDDAHDRYVGATCEMLFGGVSDKAVILYNRWASMADYAPIYIEARQPLTINISNAMVIVHGDDFWVPALLAA